MDFYDDGRREFYTVNGDYLRISADGHLERWWMGEWIMVKASDYPNALLSRLSELVNEIISVDYE